MTQQMFLSFSLTPTDQVWWHQELRFILFTWNHSRTQIYSADLQILNPDALKEENDKTSFKMIQQQPGQQKERIKIKYFPRLNPFI